MSQLENKSSTQETLTYEVPKRKASFFETKVLPILKYIGFIGTGILIVAYIVVVMVLIQGFKIQANLNMFVFAFVNAVIGFFILQFLKFQGESFAKNLPENKPIIEAYYKTRTKDKKVKSMQSFWISSTIKDLFLRAGSVALSTFGVIYIVIQGSNDYNLLLLALVNILLFVCFGLLALNKAYEFYNNRHVPYMVEKLNEVAAKPTLSQKDLQLALANLEVNTYVQVQKQRVQEPDGTGK